MPSYDLFSAHGTAQALLAAALLLSPIYLQAAEMTDDKPASSSQTTIYVGTYTGKGSDGIYRFTLDRSTAQLKPEGLAAPIANPSFLALSPDQKYLLCCNEISDFHGKKQGAGTSFHIDSVTHNLTQISQAASGGAGPCYVSVSPEENAVLLANYGSGSVALVPFDAKSGQLTDAPVVAQHEGGSGVVAKRQDAPHAHCFRTGPAGKFAFAVDLGLDQIIAYPVTGPGTFNTSAPLINQTDPGAGPRHIAFHPNGKYAYSSNELNNTVTAWTLDSETGKLHKIESVGTLPDGFSGTNYPAEVLVHPNGKYVYLSNRGHNSVAVFRVDETTGKLTAAGHEPTRGDHPRGMSLSPEGDFLLVANQDSDSLVAYRVNAETGLPEFASEYKGINRPTDFEFLK
jgi:6-phosphogluconolactonase